MISGGGRPNRFSSFSRPTVFRTKYPDPSGKSENPDMKGPSLPKPASPAEIRPLHRSHDSRPQYSLEVLMLCSQGVIVFKASNMIKYRSFQPLVKFGAGNSSLVN